MTKMSKMMKVMKVKTMCNVTCNSGEFNNFDRIIEQKIKTLAYQ